MEKRTWWSRLVSSDLSFVISDIDDTRSSQISKIHDRSRSANPDRLTAATFPSHPSKAHSSDRIHDILNQQSSSSQAPMSQIVHKLKESDETESVLPNDLLDNFVISNHFYQRSRLRQGYCTFSPFPPADLRLAAAAESVKQGVCMASSHQRNSIRILNRSSP
jgi:hypothetical protein